MAEQGDFSDLISTLDNLSSEDIATDSTDATAADASINAPNLPAKSQKTELGEQQQRNVKLLLDVALRVSLEVGRAKMLVSDLLTVGQGSVVELHRLVGEDLDLMVNGKLIAKAEVVVINEHFGCRIKSIVSPENRVNHLGG